MASFTSVRVTTPSTSSPLSSNSARMTPSNRPHSVLGVMKGFPSAEGKRNAIFEMVVSVISKAGLNSTVSNGESAESSDGCSVAPVASLSQHSIGDRETRWPIAKATAGKARRRTVSSSGVVVDLALRRLVSQERVGIGRRPVIEN